MATCGECAFFFRIPEGDCDYEKGKGDCVTQQQDLKGRFWLSKPASETDKACDRMKPR